MSNASPSDEIHSVPPEKHIHHDLVVDGILRLGDDFLIEGNVIAQGGIMFGDGVTVEGDLFTDGEVDLGPGCQIQGQIRPFHQAPGQPEPQSHRATERGPGSQPRTATAPIQDAAAEMRFATIQATLDILGDLVWSEDPGELRDRGHRLPSIDPQALEDVQAGLHELMDEVYRDGSDQPWTAEDIIHLLFQRIAPMILPVEVTRLAPDQATLEIARPQQAIGDHGPADWPVRALALLNLLAQAAHPEARITPADVDELLADGADPDRIWATLHLPERPEPAA